MSNTTFRAAMEPRDVLLLLAVIVLLFLLLLQRRESARIIQAMRRIRQTHSVVPIKARSAFIDRALLDEVNAMMEYLNRERRELYRREEEIRAMVTGISHDFRTPLTSISGYVQVLRQERGHLSEEETERYLAIIEGRAASLAALAEDFYTYSSLGSFDMEAKPEMMNPLHALRAVLAQYYLDLEKHFPVLKIDIPELAVKARTDRIFLERIFSNLLRNALTYGAEYFHIVVRRSPNLLEITFSNGLPEQAHWNQKNIEQVFERRFSVDWAKGASSTGLGLYIARSLLEELDGSLRAEVDEKSFSLICSLPLEEPEVSEPAQT